MNLGDAIALSADALTAFEAGDDAELLAELNRPQIGVKNARGGLVTMAEAADLIGVELTATFNFTIQSVIETLRQTPADDPAYQSNMAQALFMFDFRERFSKSDLGADLSNTVMRATLSGLLSQAGWTAEMIASVLSLGLTQRSPMQHIFGRDATAADITEYRARRDYDAAWLNNVQAAYNLGDRAAMVTGLRAVADALEA